MEEQSPPPSEGQPILVLASGSPRRSQLLDDGGYTFRVVAPSVDESPLPQEQPTEMVLRLAVAKAKQVGSHVDGTAVILGCDTSVVFEGNALGKPTSPAHAIEMLLRLGGRSHDVITGYAVLSTPPGRIEGPLSLSGIVTTRVSMKPITPAAAADYVATGEPLDKAGSYAIQGIGGALVAGHEGSYTNIVGLPMETVRIALAESGVFPVSDSEARSGENRG